MSEQIIHPKVRERRKGAWWRPSVVSASFFISALLLAAAAQNAAAQSSTDQNAAAQNVADDVRLLREQNALLKQQVQQQGGDLDTLKQKVQQLEAVETARETEAGDNPAPAASGYNFGRVNLSAEGGVAFFNTGSDGFAPHPEFAVDEARLFVEAPVWDEVYFFGETDLATRENLDTTTLNLGELYLDFQDVSRLWGKDGQLNVRAGRLFIPFGEEYMNRFAIDDPLISHSLTDFWGYDQGVEIYGKLGEFSYVAAVQNGGGNELQDFAGDKSVAGRISFDPNPHWHFSVSGMRTGDLNAQQDQISALWFANAWFHSLGSPATTRFQANLVEGDVTARWRSGHVGAFGGYARYDDNDPAADNGRNLFFYSVEAVQNLPKKFFLATRFSQIFADKGYPIAGFGNLDEYGFGDPATELWRWSLGAGYRFSDRLVIKVEYALEHGQATGGGRDNEDFFGTEAAFKF